jgi:hypothetical protein
MSDRLPSGKTTRTRRTPRRRGGRPFVGFLPAASPKALTSISRALAATPRCNSSLTNRAERNGRGPDLRRYGSTKNVAKGCTMKRCHAPTKPAALSI